MKGLLLSMRCFALMLLGLSSNALCESEAALARVSTVAARHPYRHGTVLPTSTKNAIRAARASELHLDSVHFFPPLDIASKTLSYGGGLNTTKNGVTSNTPRVYLVVFGSQWGTQRTDDDGFVEFSNDKSGLVLLLERFFSSVGDGKEKWSTTMTQYCDGPSPTLAAGATNCPPDANFIPYPSGGVLAGVWYDNAQPSLTYASVHDLAAEAVKAAAYFKNVTSDANRYVQYVILSPPQTHPDLFNTSSPDAVFCAWHDYTSDPSIAGDKKLLSQYGDIAFTNMPYVTDLSDCGANEVNPGAEGALDGVTVAASHEYAETLTDQFPPSGWVNLSPSTDLYQQEIGDECALLQPAAAGLSQEDDIGAGNVAMHGRYFAVQALWSNKKKACTLATR